MTTSILRSHAPQSRPNNKKARILPNPRLNPTVPEGSCSTASPALSMGDLSRSTGGLSREQVLHDRSAGSLSRSTGDLSRSTRELSREQVLHDRSTGSLSRSTGELSRSTGDLSCSTGKLSREQVLYDRSTGGNPSWHPGVSPCILFQRSHEDQEEKEPSVHSRRGR